MGHGRHISELDKIVQNRTSQNMPTYFTDNPDTIGYYLVNLPTITGNKEYIPIYIGPYTYTQMIEASKANKHEHFGIYYDGKNQYIVKP